MTCARSFRLQRQVVMVSSATLFFFLIWFLLSFQENISNVLSSNFMDQGQYFDFWVAGQEHAPQFQYRSGQRGDECRHGWQSKLVAGKSRMRSRLDSPAHRIWVPFRPSQMTFDPPGSGTAHEQLRKTWSGSVERASCIRMVSDIIFLAIRIAYGISIFHALLPCSKYLARTTFLKCQSACSRAVA